MALKKLPPLPLAAIGLITGIIASYFRNGDNLIITIGLLVSFIVLFICTFWIKKQAIATLSGLISMILLGAITFSFHQKEIPKAGFSLSAYTSKVIEVSKTKKNNPKLLVEVISSNPYDPEFIDQKILIYPSKDDQHRFEVGANLVIHSAPKRIEAPKNPKEFDYRQFCARKDIYFHQFLKEEDLQFILPNDKPSLLTNIRDYIIDIIDQYSHHPDANAILKAFIIGHKNELSPEVKENFQYSGTIHLLAISGLHVGIFYQTLLLLFIPLRKVRSKPQWIETIVIISCIWSFGLLIGLPISVSRACLMFSLIILGNQISRSTTTYHSLALSAILILLCEPRQLFDIGFQLSYLAVLGIISIVPLFNRFDIRNQLLKLIWKTLLISLAAQIAVFPLVLYYFHQFPTYFLLANLIAIPMASIIIWCSLGLIFSHFIGIMSGFIGSTLDHLLSYFNAFLHTISLWPISIIEPTHLVIWEIAFLYGIILFIFLFLKKKRFVYCRIAFLFILAFSLGLSYRKIRFKWHTHFAVYSVPPHSAIHFFGEQTNYLHKSPSLTLQNIDFHIRPFMHRFRETRQLDSIFTSSLLLNHQLFTWKGFSFLSLDSQYPPPRFHCKIDYIIVNRLDEPYYKELNTALDYGTLVVIQKENVFISEKTNLYHIGEKGAYVRKLPKRF